MIANIGAHSTAFFSGVLVILSVAVAKVVAVVNLFCGVEFCFGHNVPDDEVSRGSVNANPVLQYTPPGAERLVEISSQSQNPGSITRE